MYLVYSRVPSCQLYAKWTGREGQPVELTHRVELLGAKDPCSYFLIQPPTLQSPLATRLELSLSLTTVSQKRVHGRYTLLFYHEKAPMFTSSQPTTGY